jgi:predicted transposase/invertase (TIGR01784 family)
MQEVPVSGIHNNFVQDLFKNPENARGFLERTLPADLAAITDFSSLNYEDTSYVDPHLSDYQTDLMFRFSARDGQPGKYYLLFEHKSYGDTDTALQMAGYLIQSYKDQRKKNPGRYLITTVPFLFSQGIDGEWKQAITLSDLFGEQTKNHPVFGRFIPMYDTILVDIAKENLEEFKSLKYLHSSLILLKSAKSGIIEPIEEALYELFKDEKMIVTRRTLILYFIRTSGLNPEILKEKILNPEVRKEIMTTAEMLIQEGIERGIERGIEKGIEKGIEMGKEEGREEGREEGAYQKACQTAKAMIRAKKLEYKEIASYTDLTLEDIERLAKES